MALLRPSTVSSRLFVHAGGLLAADASDLGPGFDLGPVYDDACDVGFTVVSHRTGGEVVFSKVGQRRDQEGDLLATDFVAVTPGHTGLRAVLFND